MKTAIRFHDIKELHDYPLSEIVSVTIKEDTLQMVVDPGNGKNGKFWKFCILPLFTVKATKLQHDFNERRIEIRIALENWGDFVYVSLFKTKFKKKIFKILKQFKAMTVKLSNFFVYYKMSRSCIYFPRPMRWFNDMVNLH